MRIARSAVFVSLIICVPLSVLPVALQSLASILHFGVGRT